MRSAIMRFLTLGVVLLGSGLAACGGGDGSGSAAFTPGGDRTHVSYASKLVFVGPLAGVRSQSAQQIQPELASLGRIQDDETSTPTPIMIASAISNNCNFGCNVAGSEQGVVEALVSPQPSVTPTISFSQTATDVEIVATPTPAPSASPEPLPSGVIAEAGVASNGDSEVQSTGTATATIGDPVDESPTTPVYQYLAIAADCIADDSPSSSGPGWAWNGSAWTQVSNPSQADVYVTGSSCDGLYNVVGDSGTLHFPGCGAFVSTDTAFCSLLASQWADTYTSMSIATLEIQNGDGSINAELIAKTRNGSYTFKVFPNALGGSAGDMSFDGAIEVSSSGVDGF
jgi:hypothetical protein